MSEHTLFRDCIYTYIHAYMHIFIIVRIML